MRELIVAGIAITIRESERLTQDYETLGATGALRMADGALKHRTAWHGKIKTVISGEGVTPSGLSGIDHTLNHNVKCIKERGVSSSSNVINVPSGRRADYGVEGLVHIGSKIVKTPVSLSGDTATLTPVTGAEIYQAIYWPEFTCKFEPVEESGRVRGARHTWRLIGEQV